MEALFATENEKNHNSVFLSDNGLDLETFEWSDSSS